MQVKEKIFCAVRKKYFIATPEEKVRQKVLHFLNSQQGISFNRMAVERQIGHTKKRFDIIIHEKTTAKPVLLIECKREEEQLSQKVFDQISRYNYELKVPYLVITNWIDWKAAKIDDSGFKLLDQFPVI